MGMIAFQSKGKKDLANKRGKEEKIKRNVGTYI